MKKMVKAKRYRYWMKTRQFIKQQWKRKTQEGTEQEDVEMLASGFEKTKVD